MRVNSLGIRTVPVFLLLRNSLHRGLAPTARADSTCRLVREHEADVTVDWVLKNFGLVVVFFLFSKYDRARGAY